jgi:hypothetical protein
MNRPKLSSAGATLLALLWTTALPAGTAPPGGDLAAKPALPETGHDKPAHMEERLGEIEQKLLKLQQEFEESGQETQSSQSAVKDIKAQIEAISTRLYELYENRARNLSYGNKLEEAMARLERESAAYQEKISRPERLSPEARRPNGPPADAVLGLVLGLAAPFGFLLVEFAQLESWGRAPAGLRTLWVATLALLASVMAGTAWMLGEPVSALLLAAPEAGEAARWGEWLCRAEAAATLALAVSCVVSDRLSLAMHGALALLLSLVAYPWFGHWAFAEPGWLKAMGFHDQAGAVAAYALAGGFALAFLPWFPAQRGLSGDETAAPAYWLAGLGLLWLGGFGLALGQAGGAVSAPALLANLLLAGLGAGPAALALALWTAGAGPVYARAGAGVLSGSVAALAGLDRFVPVEALAVGALAALLHGLLWRTPAVWPLKQDQAAANLVTALVVGGGMGLLGTGLWGSPGAFAAPDLGSLAAQATGAVAALGLGLALGSAAGLLGWRLKQWKSVPNPEP